MFATMQTDAACGESISSTRLNRICHLMTTFFRAPSNLVLVVMMVMMRNITIIIIIVIVVIVIIIMSMMRGWQNMTTVAISSSGAISPMFALLFTLNGTLKQICLCICNFLSALNVKLQWYLYSYVQFCIYIKRKTASALVFVFVFVRHFQFALFHRSARYKHWIAVFP